MEILEYLRGRRSRLFILVLVPLIAAVVATALVLFTPTSYSQTATLSTAALVGGSTRQYSGPQAVNQFVAAFTAAATGPAVLATAAQEAGLPVSELQSGLTVAQQGSSSDMALTYTSTSPAQLTPALKAVESATFNNLFSLQTRYAKKQTSRSAKALAKVNTKLAELGDRHDTADPPSSYQAELNQLNSLLQQQVSLRVAGDRSSAAALRPYIAHARKVLKRYQLILAQYRGLIVAQRAASGSLATAQSAYRAARSQQEVAAASENTFYGKVHSVSRVGQLVRTLLPVLGASIFVAVLLIFMLEFLRLPGRRQQNVPEQAV